jgi:hypothetical protein
LLILSRTQITKRGVPAYPVIEELYELEHRGPGHQAGRVAPHPDLALERVETKLSEMALSSAEPTRPIDGTIPHCSNLLLNDRAAV